MSRKKKTLVLYKKAFLSKTDIFSKSYWIRKFISKFMLQGQRTLAEKYVYLAFLELKKQFKREPWGMLFFQIEKFRPLISFINKRMGRKFNPIPMPIKERRQLILSLNYITKYIKTIVHRDLDTRIFSGLTELFTMKRNAITRKIAEDVKYLADSRIHLHFRWK